MTKAIQVVVVVALLALAGGGSAGAKSGSASTPPAKSNGIKSCVAAFTEARSASRLTVKGDTCAKAQTVAMRVVSLSATGCLKLLDKKGKIGLKHPCVQQRYTCSAAPINGHKGLAVKCVRGERVVRFKY